MMVPEGYEEDISHHKELFSGPSLELGKIHWYIQKADTEMDSRSTIEKEGEHGSVWPETTAFGEEVGVDEINWWVFKRELEIEELRNKTETTLKSVQKLKEDSSLLRERFTPKSYLSLIEEIKGFTEDHAKEIHDLHDYVLWLHTKDVLAPRILFTYRVWGSTRLSDRMIRITANTIDQDHPTVEKCVETACGLRISGTYTVGDIYLDVSANIYESIDDEYQGPILVPKETVIKRTSHRVINEFATYFEFLRNSLRNIILEIQKFNDQTKLLYRESFWKSFVTKAMSSERIENQLWDFKKTLEMWHIVQKDEKKKFEIGFCEQIASFANVCGGVLIMGITDKPPRKIIGVHDIENKLKFTKLVLKKYIDHTIDFVHFQPITLKDDSGQEKSCLVIAVAQTKDGIIVRDEKGKFSCPERLETGLHRADYETIRDSKKYIMRDNYNFMSDLYTFLHDR